MNTVPQTDTAIAEVADQALDLASQGVAVFPLAAGAKSPATSNGFYSASTDPAEVSKLFAAVGPRAGVGIMPARCSIPGGTLLILDGDSDAAFRLLRDLIGEPTVTTGGRGAHWYVVLPDGIPDGLTKTSAKCLEIDIIGAGGGEYVCAPPTHIEGRDEPYTWVGAIYTLESDSPGHAWLCELAASSKAKRTARKPRSGDSETPALDEWMRGTSWAEILTEDGWTDTGRADACGCPVWQHPWGTETDRSATVHEEGCTASQSDFAGGSLHSWSTTAEHRVGAVSASKYDYLANVRYGGDYAETREAEGIPDEADWGSGCALDVDELLEELAEETAAEQPSKVNSGPKNPFSPTSIAAISQVVQGPSTVPPSLQQVPASAQPSPGWSIPTTWLRTAAEAAAAGWHSPVPRKKDGTDDTKNSQWDAEVFPLGPPSGPDLMKAIFDFNDFTRWVFHQARASKPHPTGPIAFLMTELVRAGMRVPPNVQPKRGTPLSFSVIRVGDSGKGKSLAMNKRRWSSFVPAPASGSHSATIGQSTDDAQFDIHRSLGSGEVMASMLCDEVGDTDVLGKPVKRWKQKEHASAWFEEAEFRATLKRGGKDASTIFDAVNAGWAGENPATATLTRGSIELPQPFNIFFTGGMQTSVWLKLLEQITGFLQRTLLVGVSDAWRVLPQDVICSPPPAGYVPPLLPHFPSGPATFNLCQEVNDAEELNAYNAAFEHTESDDDWSTHLFLVQLRLACLAAVRFGTLTVTPEIWAWSGLLIEHHRRVLAWLQAIAEKSREKGLQDEGFELGLRETFKNAAKRERVREAVKKMMKFLLESGGSATRRQTREAVGRLKDVLDDAEKLAEKEGLITLEPGVKGSMTLRVVTDRIFDEGDK